MVCSWYVIGMKLVCNGCVVGGSIWVVMGISLYLMCM